MHTAQASRLLKNEREDWSEHECFEDWSVDRTRRGS